MTLSKKYDVIVLGGGTAGTSTAYNCSKLGMKTLLVEKNSYLGGTMTAGLVTPAMKSADNQINTDFFNDLISELRAIKGQITYENNPGWFNPELTKIALDKLMSKTSVDVLLNTSITSFDIDNRTLKGITLNTDMLSVYIGAKYFVDSSGNCEFGKILNCNFLEDKINFQPVSLRFEMSGIDMSRFSSWLMNYDADRNVTTSHVIDGAIHLSTAYTWDKGKKWALAPLFDDAVSKGLLKDTDRNYFQVFTIPNMPSGLSFNCPRIYFDSEIDPLDPIMVSKALVSGREAILRIADFCREYFPGFENAYISNIADALGVRVSRRIKGKYVYTVDDLKSGKKFENPVLISNYPIDVHSNVNGKSVLEHTVQEYQLPVESLISADYDNFFVAGRCLSADFYAQAALRIQPSCFSMGEGLAKWIAKEAMNA